MLLTKVIPARKVYLPPETFASIKMSFITAESIYVSFPHLHLWQCSLKGIAIRSYSVFSLPSLLLYQTTA
uniref:Uncharacterized protein n=1 Tax=Scophthalmus maximus TaxID=52904 RepID=A0A8D3B945_SCOMX